MLKKAYILFLCAGLLFSCNNDDDLVAACELVTNVSSSAITNNSATITWTDTNNSGSYLIEYGISGFIMGTGTSVSSTQTSIELTGLSPFTTYDVYVQNICSTDNISMYTDVHSFTTLAPDVIPQYFQNLSQLNLFTGDLADLNVTPYAFEYDLNTRLYSDYAHKQRFIVLPEGEKLTYNGEGLPLFPDNSLIAKTFYYNNDERDLSLGRKIIETRVLIKIDGSWVTGDYKWNDAQTEAVLDPDGSIVPVTWIDAEGESNTIDYQIPSDNDCFTCHRTGTERTPIGPKMRTMNFSVNGTNQLQQLIDNNLIDGLTDPNTVSVLPKWDDATNYTLEERARAYFDINCAHCHIEGAFCEFQSTLRLDYERSMEDSNIANRRNSIINRISTYNQGFSMPLTGTTIIHEEGVELLLEYLNTLE
ncbi:fibronectin type III domain-containing protein [uncultured Psychroserpens sp.]|uniref:fibronectin type III domain-containing protein n=1 Tax=uncultured Psychroserpens sp. TaxID=255436 RepID=UPI0026070E53|nr:fibronectin type III domain-containing protein [uncultured Psychroserpens sp.]